MSAADRIIEECEMGTCDQCWQQIAELKGALRLRFTREDVERAAKASWTRNMQAAMNPIPWADLGSPARGHLLSNMRAGLSALGDVEDEP